MSALVGILGVGAPVVFIIGLTAWLWGKQAQAVRETARIFNLQPLHELTDAHWKIKEGFSGLVERIEVRLGVGERLVMVPHAAAAIQGVLLSALFPQPLGFQIELRRKAGTVKENCKHPDPLFAKACAINTNDERRAQAFLNDPRICARIAQFLKEGLGSAFIDKRGVHTVIFNAQWVGSKGLVPKVRQSVALAKSLADPKRLS